MTRRAKIVEGRLKKIQDEMALVNQDSLTDPNMKVSELIKQTIAAVGENIQVRKSTPCWLPSALRHPAPPAAAWMVGCLALGVETVQRHCPP